MHFLGFHTHGISETIFNILIFIAVAYVWLTESSWGVPRRRDYILGRGIRRRSMKTLSDKLESDRWVKKPARTLVDRPDTHLDALIAAGSIDEARKYRISMEKMSREMMDEHSLRNYRIYEEVIEDRQKELDAKRQPVPAISPMTIPVPAPAIIPRIAEKTAGPAVPEEKPAPREIQFEETQTSINPGDYTELIEL